MQTAIIRSPRSDSVPVDPSVIRSTARKRVAMAIARRSQRIVLSQERSRQGIFLRETANFLCTLITPHRPPTCAIALARP